jgi:hypothetical protein
MHAPRYRARDRVGGGGAGPAARDEGAAPVPEAAPEADLSHLSDRKRKRAERALAFGSAKAAAESGELLPRGGQRYTEAFYGTNMDPGARLKSRDGVKRAERKEAGRGGGWGGRQAPPPSFQPAQRAAAAAVAPAAPPLAPAPPRQKKSHMKFED